MKKLLSISVVLLALAVIGCAGPAGEYSDGQYRAEYSAFDSRGWKPFLNITIEGGKIAQVQYDYVNAAGGLKSQDAAYNERMESISGFSVAKFVPASAEALVKSQQAPIDTISGASSSSASFNAMAVPLLAQAEAGNQAKLILPTDGTYAIEAEADSRGYIGRVELTFADDRIARAVYDEVKKDESGAINYRKSEDQAYSERWGQNAVEVYIGYANALVQTQDPGQVDVVTGATSAHAKFVELSNRILDIRGR